MAGALLHLHHGNSTLRFSCRSNLNRSPLPSRQSTVQMTRGDPSWAFIHADVVAHIKQAMPMKEPLVVFEPMHHLVFAAPRTTVPPLCVAACELVGGHRDQAMPAASALLLMLAAAYTHEHLFLTDRPKPGPTTHHAYGLNIELLTGDGIIPFGFELLARSDDPTHENSDRIKRVIIEISRAVGSEGLVEGQYRKILNTESDGGEMRHVSSAKHVAEKKEGGLHACGAACGAVLGGGSEEEIERLRQYGFYVGMIQGLLRRVEIAEKGLMKEVEELRNLAHKQLEAFEGRKIEVISSFLYV